MDGASGQTPAFTLEQLRTFAAVAATEHVSRAAETLGISPGAVSQQLRLFEQALGLPLFTRSGRRLHITDVGVALRGAAQAALAATAAVQQIPASFLQLEVGSLRLSSSNIATYRLPQWIGAFLEQHPRVDVHLSIDSHRDALRKLQDASIHCAIIGGPPPRDGVDSLLVERDELRVVAAPQLIRRKARFPFDRTRYLARGAGSATELLAAQLLGRAYRAGPVVEIGAGAMRPALLAGLGYAVMPHFAVAGDVEDGRLTVVPLPRRRRPVFQSFHAVRRGDLHLPAADAFWAHLRRMARGQRETRLELATPTLAR